MRRNRHDTWQRFCDLQQELLAETGLPIAITYAEHRFRDLLRQGRVETRGATASLAELAGTQWEALERFAAVFFREFESYAPLDLFPAFHEEVERRGSKFRL
jgi:hypothetical protein